MFDEICGGSSKFVKSKKRKFLPEIKIILEGAGGKGKAAVN